MIFHSGGKQAEFQEMKATGCAHSNFTLEKRIPETQAGLPDDKNNY
jgi:hypothetical protein